MFNDSLNLIDFVHDIDLYLCEPKLSGTEYGLCLDLFCYLKNNPIKYEYGKEKEYIIEYVKNINKYYVDVISKKNA